MTRTETKTILGPRRLVAIVWSTFAALTLAMFSGCSGEPPEEKLPELPLHSVKGKVLAADDKPVTEGEVEFVPVKQPGRSALGKLGADGSFTLKTGDKEGAAEGEYRVRISSPLSIGTGKTGKRVVPIEYEDEDASQLKATVKSGSNDLAPFKTTPVKPKAASKERMD